jgi:hypothetical protein
LLEGRLEGLKRWTRQLALAVVVESTALVEQYTAPMEPRVNEETHLSADHAEALTL